MSVKVFIDGSSGTTGLRIADRLAARPDIELLSISAEGRKDVNERAKVINSADLAFLCLPDAASKEVMPLLRPDVKVLDTSTATSSSTAVPCRLRKVSRGLPSASCTIKSLNARAKCATSQSKGQRGPCVLLRRQGRVQSVQRAFDAV